MLLDNRRVGEGTLIALRQAFIDLKRYIQLNNKDAKVHYWAGSLLFHNNAYDEALRAYSECA